MSEIRDILPAETAGTEITRFNALKHGVLSRYTVLALAASLAAEHRPNGPTEEHLVEELASILWRKRRLRLAEAAAHQHSLEDATEPYRGTVKAAMVHLDGGNQIERAGEARWIASDSPDFLGIHRESRIQFLSSPYLHSTKFSKFLP